MFLELRPYQREACEAIRASDLPRTPTEAKTAGSKYYFTGVACKRGHVAPRQTSNAVCAECRAVTFKRFYDKAAPAMRERALATHAAKKDDPEFRATKAGKAKEWYEANKERALDYSRRRKRLLRDARHYEHFMAALEAEARGET